MVWLLETLALVLFHRLLLEFHQNFMRIPCGSGQSVPVKWSNSKCMGSHTVSVFMNYVSWCQWSTPLTLFFRCKIFKIKKENWEQDQYESKRGSAMCQWSAPLTLFVLQCQNLKVPLKVSSQFKTKYVTNYIIWCEQNHFAKFWRKDKNMPEFGKKNYHNDLNGSKINL